MLLTAAERETLRGVIEDEAGEVTARVATLEGEFTSIVESAALANVDDEHDPEGATIAYERAFVAAQLSSARALLSELWRARSELDDGHYGECECCGRPIAIERLCARPTARRCMPCAR